MKQANKIEILIIGILLIISTFMIDVQTPLGVADGMLYISIVLLTLWLNELIYSFVAGSVATVLIVLGYFLSPQNDISNSIIINRILSVIITWITVLLLYAFKRTEKKAKLYKDGLISINERKKLLETIAANYPNGIMAIIDREYRYTYAQGQELEAMGLSSDFVGSLFTPLRFEDQAPTVKELLLKGFQGEKVTFEFYQPSSKQHFLMYGAHLPDLDGEIHQLLFVCQNITIRKRAEQDIRNALQKEKELNEVKSRFVTTASHEFRTPLAAILSSAHLIKMYSQPEGALKLKKHIERITASVGHLNQILNDFLSLGKIEGGKTSVQLSDISIDMFFTDLTEELTLAYNQGQKIVLQNLLEKNTIRSDQQILKNILINLLSNALKYSPENSEVCLSLKEEDSHLTISVIDQGIGIPESEQQHLFQTFFRASNVENIKGTGMGLHIVKKYVEILNGGISFSSDQGKGSCFMVKLPALA